MSFLAILPGRYLPFTSFRSPKCDITLAIEENKRAQITKEFGQTYKTVLNFVHQVQDVFDDGPEFDLTGFYEIDEIYLQGGEKGLDRDETRDRRLIKGTRNLRVRQTAGRDTLRQFDGRVRFHVRDDLEDVDGDIVEYCDEDDPTILCTDQ